VARFTQIYINAHLKEGAQKYEDESIFLPHPSIWRKSLHERKIIISKETAIEFLSSYRQFGPDVAIVFDDWISDIEDIARS